MRPRITLTRQPLGYEEISIAKQMAYAQARVEAVLIIGTQLKVPGMKRFAREIVLAARRKRGVVVWVSEDKCPLSGVEFEVLMKCDEFARLCRLRDL